MPSPECSVSNAKNRACHANPSVVQIVPALPPRIDGVGDFAFALAAEMHTAFSISTAFVVRKPDLGVLSVLTISEENKRTLDSALMEAVPAFSGTVVLHYAGYGYDALGSPDWLVNALCRIKARGHRIVTIFHELYATGMPWKRSFWNSAEQQRIFEGLVGTSDICITSNPVYLRRIKQVSSSAVVFMLPVPSNMGEIGVPLPLSNRSRRMVIAGQTPTKQRALKGHQNGLLKACSVLRLTDVIEIGEESPNSSKFSRAAARRGIRHYCTGWLPANEVSKMLADSYCGIATYNPSVWQKSGVIASYHAHGLFTVVIPDERDTDNLVREHIGMSLDDLLRIPGPSTQVLEAIARARFESYMRSQSVSRYASRFVSLAQLG